MDKKNLQNKKKLARNREATEQALIRSVGELLAEHGFSSLGVNALARQAGVDKVLIYRYFGGLPGLIKAYGQEGDFWPSIEELAGGDVDAYRKQPLKEKLISLGRNYLLGIRNRPVTMEVLAWEMVERNELIEELEIIREKRMTRFSEEFLQAGDGHVELDAINAIIGGGLTYLLCRARKIKWYNGVDLKSAEGWQRIDKALVQIIEGMSAAF